MNQNKHRARNRAEQIGEIVSEMTHGEFMSLIGQMFASVGALGVLLSAAIEHGYGLGVYGGALWFGGMLIFGGYLISYVEARTKILDRP